MSRIAHNVSELIGNTPLVRLNRLVSNQATVLAKVESFNPASSVKDRIAAAIIDAAEASGELKPGGTIIEATSGNTGVALAMVGASRGYKVVITMPSSMSIERRLLIRAFGAEIVLTDPSTGIKGAVAEAERIRDERPGSIIASQFTNPANPAVHRRTTAEEIWGDTDGNIDILVAGVGTGGTVSGVGAVLKERKSSVQVIAVQPEESPLLTGGDPAPHGIQGIGPNFVAQTYDSSVVDEVLSVNTAEAMAMSRRAAAEEGLLVGISSGAALAAAVRVAERPENAGKTIVVVLPDTGERYLSTKLFEDLRD
ncbi:cysteine synthase A [Schaalia sp. lx-100]|uniref:cysteine synthase A n=1 Tax=Schaalia sp. lx-100 TaxID=2899081 RepID=UPI001E5AF78B|nr:cysteine synthase A [Schaalia sp. lx-100]MCD4557980.1 cysteine synthase A [Schaalia sp. lx-100]